MKGRLEREFKLTLPSEEALAAVAARLGGAQGPPARQVNHFLDTDARALRAARLALRVREEDGSFTLTLKGPAEASAPDAPTTRPEEEHALQPDEARRILDGTLAPLALLTSTPLVRRATEVVGSSRLAPIGSFENERLRIGPIAFPAGSGSEQVVIELDRTHYPGGVVERELEVEVEDASQAAAVGRGLRELFGTLGLPVVEPPSKAARLFRILDRANREVPGTRRGPA